VKTRAFLFAVGLLLAAVPAAAQGLGDPPAPSSGWTVHPNERHLLVRAEFGIGARLRDPFSYGVLSPPSVLVEGTYAFLHLGNFLFGPSLGLQGGIDRNGAQFTVQPGGYTTLRLGAMPLPTHCGLPAGIARPAER
jgi:hypothetical protein